MPVIRAYRVHCDQCEMLSINGVACHEHGCPNMGAKWDRETRTWVKYYECWNCGCEVLRGEECDCTMPMDHEDPTEDDDEEDNDQ